MQMDGSASGPFTKVRQRGLIPETYGQGLK